MIVESSSVGDDVAGINTIRTILGDTVEIARLRGHLQVS